MNSLNAKSWNPPQFNTEEHTHSMACNHDTGNQSAYPLFQGLAQVILLMIEYRDAYTATHQRNVSDLACMIAEQLGWSSMRIAGLRLAGLIHDIGKISIPSEILYKPTKLSELEYAIIKQHSFTGFQIIKDIEAPWPLAKIILEHHERLDGSGYPYGIKGDSILPESLEDLNAYISSIPVKCGVFMIFDFVDCCVNSHGRAVWPVHYHGVSCVQILKERRKFGLSNLRTKAELPKSSAVIFRC
jgi:putative nucleotidyltransferase with HDIG domain